MDRIVTPRTVAGAAVVAGVGAWSLTDRATRWGSTPEERDLDLPGDAYLQDGAASRVVMTRAVTVNAAPETVWPWVAQTGRGAGFYSYDHLDNGGRTSARHIVTWIPEPALGDASALGYLRAIEPGVGLTWWLPRSRFLGAWVRLAVDMRVRPAEHGTRLIVRVTGDADGLMAPAVLALFRPMDSIMAIRQLVGIRERAEAATRSTEVPDRETGRRDQYQLYEVVYASGETAGVAGEESAARWRRAAIEDGILPAG